ncbi:type IV pili methyl-accepting chemotaxis transducer N-terminal domain-containing protein [Yoonia sp. F2084L]|uniref:type IV pili methyl-accepting chemotaxis transducer N-terminal domain-containing protein n=1 Tax=Yoonia sp. F2084L TaxID=2926419 RepID=UPI001FF34989|nr:type IV pili methyl-accepting chemotaxis transducer N-terminal domain-containing protein [Yoonia sp. F2084L]MCK0095240.1 type IV pili methyl-accepting chemotaxis transducer N-terminal domain-containing protein [Yoonia sp. F2084L]
MKIRNSKTFPSMALVFAASVLSTTAFANNPATGQAASTSGNFIEDIGASQRVDFAGKLRMLSQRVVAAACYADAGIDREDSLAVLNAAAAEFVVIKEALEVGNPDLGIIGPEERARTLAGLERLTNLWTPVGALADRVAAGDGTTADVAKMAELSGPLLEMAKLVVGIISTEYSNPAELLFADAIAIDIAGRQRMLSQRMSKNACLLANGLNTDTARAELQAARDMFDTSLTILRMGEASVGIKAPPTQQIADELDVVIARWATLQPIVDMALEGGTLDEEQLEIMFNGANAMTGEMNTVVGSYSEASKLDL